MRDGVRHWREAYGLAWTLCRDRARAEELCQEALVRLGTMRRAPEVDRPVRELLLTIVRNLALSDMRRPEVGRAAPEALDGVPAPAADGPLRQASRNEEQALVRAALERMDPGWAAMLYLRDGLGLRYAEIARVLEKSEDVVRVTLHRARRRVREHLGRALSPEDVG